MAIPNRTTASRAGASRPYLKGSAKATPEIIKVSEEHRPFRRINYYLMGGCVLLIIVGFLLMLGGGSSVENGFNPDIFSTRRIAVGPAITFLGFLLMAFAIIWSPKKSRKNHTGADA